MSKKWYRANWVKGLWIVLLHMAAVLLMVCVLFLWYQYNNGNKFSGFGQRAYENTEMFSGELQEMTTYVFQGISGEEYLKTKGKNGKDRIVDIMAYNDTGEISNENTSGFAYSMESINQWAEEIKKDRGSLSRSVVVCRKEDNTYQYYDMKDFREKVKSGELKIMGDFFSERDAESQGSAATGELQEEILAALEGGYYDSEVYNIKWITGSGTDGEKLVDMWLYDGTCFQELYKPISGDGILEIANSNVRLNGRLVEMYEGLDNVLASVMGAAAGQEMLEEYGQGNTNVRYFFADKTHKKIYTNEKKYEEYEALKKTVADIESRECYVLVSPTLADCRTNMKHEPRQLRDLVERHLPADCENYVYGVWVDTDYPIMDKLQSSRVNFLKYNQWMMPAVAGVIGAAVVFLIGLLWLTVVAGRRQTDEKLHLNFFDRWFTEPAALAALTAVCLPLSFGFAWGYSAISDLVILMSPVVLLFCAASLGGYLSLVRRIKGRTLWKNSLVRLIFHWVRKSWRKIYCRGGEILKETARDTKSVVKLAAFYVGFVGVNIWLSALVGGFGLFLLMVFDGAILMQLLKKAKGRQVILDGLQRITNGELNYKIDRDSLYGEQQTIADYINRIGDGLDAAVEQSLKNERMKTELITNVSHDIKTPLTSIINYIDLLKRENFTDPKILGYLEVLEQKSQRLKVLTEDVVEASKVSTGNIKLEMTVLNLTEMIQQISGEFAERFEGQNLNLMLNLPSEPVIICGDGQRMWRILENVYCNAAKYAMPGTRIYADLAQRDTQAEFHLKNISAQPLNISPDELTERFIRGDDSRTTEGSGLGLSIAKSLTTLQGGGFELYLDGDLFKVTITFPVQSDLKFGVKV